MRRIISDEKGLAPIEWLGVLLLVLLIGSIAWEILPGILDSILPDEKWDLLMDSLGNPSP